MKIQEVQLEISSIELLAIISHLQLALSHPETVGETSEIVRKFIKQVSPALAEIDATYQVLIDAGFDRGTNN